MQAHRKVLVLNKSWSPVGIVTVQRAITLLWGMYANGQPKAFVVDTDSFATMTWADWSVLKPQDGDDFIKSAKDKFKIPEVVVLTRYDKLPTHRVTFSRRTLYKRDAYKCQYCGKTPKTEELTIDHILPRSRGGKTTWENCVICCLPCNARKADRLPEECGMKLRKQPKKPKYQLFKGKVIIPCDSWKKFISAAYWNVEMQHDNADE